MGDFAAGRQLSPACYNGRMSDNGREVVPWSEWEYPQAFKAEAVAIVLRTGNCAEAYREMKKRYPKRYPGRELIWRWAKTIEPERFNALQLERSERLYSKSLDLALLSGDKLEDEVEAGSITGKDLAITFGISTDKVVRIADLAQRSRESDAGHALAEAIERLSGLSVPQLNAVIKGTSPEDIIEGKVVVSDSLQELPGLEED